MFNSRYKIIFSNCNNNCIYISKIHLFLEHGQWGNHYQEYEDISGRLYRFIGEICIEYKEPPNIADVEHVLPADPNN